VKATVGRGPGLNWWRPIWHPTPGLTGGSPHLFHPGTWLLVQAGACLPGERFSYLLENQGTALRRRLEGGIIGI